MKKILNVLFLILLLSMPMVLTSCGDDKDEPDGGSDVSLLMGDTWQFQKAVVNAMGQKLEMSYREIKSYMSQEMGTNNLIIVDEKLRFTEDEMIFVNTGDRVNYRYSSNGKFWFEGMEELSEIGFNITIPSLTKNQLIFRYSMSVSGMTITEDLYYVR